MARSLPMHAGSHSFEIICITCCRSPMPGRVSRAQPISATFRKADRFQGQIPWQTSHTSHFQILGISKAEIISAALFVSSPSLSIPSSMTPPPWARIPHMCIWAATQNEAPPDLKLCPLPTQAVVLGYRLVFGVPHSIRYEQLIIACSRPLNNTGVGAPAPCTAENPGVTSHQPSP